MKKNLMVVHWSGHRILILSWFADSVYKISPTPIFLFFIEADREKLDHNLPGSLPFRLSYLKPAI
jgi:hypothetical protein